jgi:multiple sugar transport system substrate-binding protein
MPDLVKTDNGANASGGFLAGQVGMLPQGSFFMPNILAVKGLDIGATPLPGSTPGSKASFAGGDEVAITRDARNLPAAESFLRWITDRQAQSVLAKLGVMPVRTDLLPTLYADKDPRYKVLSQALTGNSHTPYSITENALFNDNNGPWVHMIDKAVFGGNVKGAQAEAQKQAQAIIDGSE